MSHKGASKDGKRRWRGEAGIDSGFTGGDHLAYSFIIPALALFAGLIPAVWQRPLWMLGWLAPFTVFALCTFFARKRSRPLYLVFLFLTAVAGLFALVASCTPAPK